jgi:plastocyanin
MRVRTLPLLIAALALAGCGEGPTTRESSHTFTVTLDDYLIRPQNISAPGGELTVTAVNRGRLGHTLRIRTKTDRNVLAFTTLQPGESKTRSFKLSRGSYTMYCVLANHEELGMHGTLVVG